ncbi:unnamed protein product, partial [Mesorhabditis spiculigera]
MAQAALIKNLQTQLGRLLEQLKDLEEERDSLSDDEYQDMKKDAREQLQELGNALDKLEGGNMAVVDEVTAAKMAIRAAIQEAFRTPEIMALFAQRDKAQLRKKLNELEVGKKHEVDALESQKGEILFALRGLNEKLSDREAEFMKLLEAKDPRFIFGRQR